MKEKDLSSYISGILHEFEDFIIERAPSVPGFHPHFEKAFWEMLLCGGKRFRPALLFSVVISHRPDWVKKAFLPALALECLHTYSLIHDDLPCMDNASLRRGHATLHKTYNETTAVLVGDGLNTYAFQLLSQSDLEAQIIVRLVRILSSYGGLNGMIIGQALDCHFENITLELEKLRFIHNHKTAKLIAASLEMGGVIANLQENQLEELRNFGLNLGLYFQIRDDIIDFIQSEVSAGKDTQNDGAKNSYVNLLGLEGARAELARTRDQLVAMQEGFSKTLRDCLEIILRDYFKEI